jgi:hypothetical protein
MSKLTPDQVDEYFNNHLPYRVGVMLAHLKMMEGQRKGRALPTEWAQVQAAFEASLITGRMFLNVLGVTRDQKTDTLKSIKKRGDDDVGGEDLGALLLDPSTLTPDEADLFAGFLKMSDKGAAHLTVPMKHPVDRTHEAIDRIMHYVRVNLYQHTGRKPPA